MDKKQKLADLKKRMQEDKTLPLAQGATNLVFGEGDPDTNIYFIGEAPGYFEDILGRPFVGQAGKLLDKLIESIGFQRSDVYISNIVRFRPPANRDPLPEEIAAFQPYVDEEIAIIDPKMIVTLGRFSMNKFLPDVKISRVHGQVRKIDWNGKTVTVIPMYHPAAALRSDEVMQQLKSDFQIIKKVLEDLEKEPEEDPDQDDSETPEQLNLL